jgi:hypothetical protein
VQIQVCDFAGVAAYATMRLGKLSFH